MNKRSTLYRKAIMALTSVFIMGLMSSMSVSAQTLDYSSWLYRKAIMVTGTGTVLEDFQVKITLDVYNFVFANAKTDGSDLRFTDSDGETLLDFWVENWTSPTSADIWVKIPEIPVGGKTIYMYYGNSRAESASNGTNTFMFFDDFTTGPSIPGSWIRRLAYTATSPYWGPAYVAHDWKYASEMQNGALYYAMIRAQNGWQIESLDPEIEQEFDFIHSQLSVNANGTVPSDALGYPENEPEYCYGLIMSNLALGYLYYKNDDPTLSQRCYDDLLLVFDYLRVRFASVGSLTDQGGKGWLLHGFSNAWKAFTDYGNTTSAGQAYTLVVLYADTFIANQPGGAWTGVASAIQENLKRDFGVLSAYEVTNDAEYLTAVAANIDYILSTFWIESNGGLEWYSNPASSDFFYECHQQWFMIAVRRLYDLSYDPGEELALYNYLEEGEDAWHFLTDNNYLHEDMYVHNYTTRGAFFSYRQITEGGLIQTGDNSWKGSYEIGAALWGMALNYGWVNNYQSTHSGQAYNYLDMMVSQIKNTPANKGYTIPESYSINTDLWNVVGSITSSIVQDNGNYVFSIIGDRTHNSYLLTDEDYRDFDDFVFETKVRMTVDNYNQCQPGVGFRYINDNNKYITQLRGDSYNDLFLRKYYNGSTFINASVSYNYTTDYYTYKIVANGNSIGLYLNGELRLTPVNAGGDVSIGGFYLANWQNVAAAYFDDVRVRKFAIIEPTTAIQSVSIWIGGTEGYENEWNIETNWSTGAVPGTGSEVFIPDGAPQLLIDDAVSCDYLTVESADNPGYTNLVVLNGGTLTVSEVMTIASDASVTVDEGGVIESGLVEINTSGSTSGSLVNKGVVNGIVVYNRHLLPKAYGGDFQLVASPVLSNSDPNTEDILRAKSWNEVTGTWFNGLMVDVVNGKGYNLKQTETGDGTVTFSGPLPADNTIEIEATCPFIGAYDGTLTGYNARSYVSNTSSNSGTPRDGGDYWGGGGWNLLGNPFASAMSVAGFIDYNFGTSWETSQFDPSYVALYIHEGATTSYKYVANSTGWEGGDYLNQPNIPAGQGFFVLAMDDLSTFTFTRDMQVHDTEVPMLKSTKTDDRWPGLQLKVKYGDTEKSTVIVYGENMTAGLDPGFDIGQYANYSEIAIYTALAAEDNGVNFDRQALPIADCTKNTVPVGIDSENGGEVTFSAITIPIGSYKFWLEDRVAGIYTDLTTKSYSVTLPEKSYGTGRFYVLVSANTPTGIERPENEDTGLRIWRSNSRIIIKGEVSERAVCQIYDMKGQRISETRLADGEMNTVTLPSGTNGIYLVRVIDGVKITTRKVAVL